MKMSKNIHAFARQNWLPLSVLLIACFAVIWFGGRMALDVIYFHDPRHQDVALRNWMTPRYVVMSYDLPRPVVLNLMNLTPATEPGKSMKDISAQMGVSLDELTQRVRAAAADYRSGQS